MPRTIVRKNPRTRAKKVVGPDIQLLGAFVVAIALLTLGYLYVTALAS